MNYYLVWVASNRYLKPEPLTYEFDAKLEAGALVLVPLGKTEVLGFIVGDTPKPEFNCKPISRQLNLSLTAESIELHSWLLEYYPSGSGTITSLFLPSSLKTKKAETLGVKPENSDLAIIQAELPNLRPSQIKVLNTINQTQKRNFLLHGETGSGKTRIYIERAIKASEKGLSSLILTPEIGLTPQLETSFKAVFGDKVVILHSDLSAQKRRQLWLKVALADTPLVIIGPRSALFAPIKRLGLIVVDEFHEPAYKQEQAPHYQAVRVAAKLAQLHSAEIIYGSATPSIAEYYLAEATGAPIIKMAKTTKTSLKISLIDATKKDNFSRHPILSNDLLKAIEQSLKQKQQVLVYLNRRGTARLVLCQSCGWQALCPNCDLPLTYHGDGHSLRCHTCGLKRPAPLSCPDCDSTELVYRVMGTKSLAETLAKFFPDAIIKRFDTDLASADRLDKQFDQVKDGQVDILVGTQMLGKGLDLPKLGLVCIVAADTSLYLPDFTASERSYQLLHQVMGRVGRGHDPDSPGEVVVQTYVPNNPVLQDALAADWQNFYARELIERQTFLFPPFCHLMSLTLSRKSPDSAERAITTLHQKLKSSQLKLRLSEPAPSYYEHTHGFYHWQLVLKALDRKELIRALKILQSLKPSVSNWTYDLDPSNLL